jgi:NADPH2:quinone reductase
MRAVVVREFSPFERLSVGELPDPKPGRGEVLLEIKVAEVNYPDMLVVAGEYQVRPPLPFSPGKAGAGVVCAVGEGVTRVGVGDRVSVQVEFGTYAEKLVAPAANVCRMPAGVDFATGAALGLAYQTAHFALVDRARMQPGERVLVLGASGGIGVASVQLAKALGASTVIAGVLGATNAQIARDAGADVILELGGADLKDSLRNDVRGATDGRGADIVIDPVGGEAAAAALRALAWRGRMVIVGFASGKIPTIQANYLLLKNIEVVGLQWSDYRERDPAWVARVQDELFRFCSAGRIKPHISRTFPLHEFKEALALLRDGKAQGKVLLQIAAAP